MLLLLLLVAGVTNTLTQTATKVTRVYYKEKKKMRKIYKHFMALALLLMLQVSTAFAVNVTYSLTTHVDHRTITGTASVNSGASLENGMPRALWRGNTTYKYYSDPELTQEITVAPATDATVYVDYVFEPPFIVSSEGAETYYYFNAYISNSRYYMCGNLGAVGPKSSATKDTWAIYGDAYCLNLKSKGFGKWLCYSGTTVSMGESQMDLGWQLYGNFYKPNNSVAETTVLATATNENVILHYDNNATGPGGAYSMGKFVTVNMSSWNSIVWNTHHELDKTNNNYSTLLVSNSSFFFTRGTYQNIYSTVWRILKADGTWNPDIVVQKGTTQTRIGMPTGQNKYTERNICNYDRYYRNANFIDDEDNKYPDNYMIPVTGNTIIYVKETYKFGEPFVTDHWITLALSYKVDNLASEFGYASDGTTPAVRVLEYTALTTNASNTKYTLTFTETDKIVAHKPYLFKADEVLEGKNLCLSKDPDWGNKSNEELEEMVNRETSKIKFRDESHTSPYVTMIGTYLDKELTVQSQHPDLLYFYFGYDKRYDPESDAYEPAAAEGKLPYNFYRVTSKNVTIHPFHCYFMIEGAPAGAKFMMMDNFGNEITSVEGIDADSFIQTTGRIYNLNGQQVGNDLEALPRGVYIVNGKKVMK